MRSLPQIALLAAAIALLPACGKDEEAPAAKAAATSQQQTTDPFQRNGELLSINVDTMPRAAFVAKLSELTGAKITVEGDNNQTVTLHIADGSLRKVLSMAMADVPYTISMQFANLQDSFPVSVSVTRYNTATAGAAAQQPPLTVDAMIQQAKTVAAQQPQQAMEQGEEEPELASMSPDAQLKYFLSKGNDDQVAIIFDMEPTRSDIALMNKLITREDVTGEVKQEILDSLSTAEYEDTAATIKLALDEKDPEVVAKAAEVLSSVGSETDIPALKAALEKTDNEDVRTAI
ncbi:MAG: HEAT repeat domain-containing protein, partial [Pseudomonadales bacterium]